MSSTRLQFRDEGSSFKFVGDNVDKKRGVRDIRSDHQGEMKHMYSLLAVKSRMPSPHFNPPDISRENSSPAHLMSRPSRTTS